MSDIILIQPKLGYVDSFIYKNTLPSALLSIARLVDKDYKVKIIDQRIDKNWKKHLLKELNQNPLGAATTCMTGMPIKYALEISKFVKDNSNIPMIWGGQHPTILPEQCLEDKNIDIVVRGEGEITFYELVKALDKNKPLKSIKGISYKKDGKILHNPDREFVDLNKLPPLPYHLINIEDYPIKRLNIPTLYLETSRGCTNNCGFCYNKSFNRCQWRAFNAENVIHNVQYALKQLKGIGELNHIRFVDDSFFESKIRVIKIANFFRKNHSLTWEAMGKISDLNMLSPSELKILEQSGCKKISIGIESGSPRILKLINKKISLKKVILLNKRLSNYEIATTYGLVSGFPTETPEDLKKTINLSLTLLNQNKNATLSSIFVYTPYPDSELYSLAQRLGLKPPTKLRGWITYDPDTANLPWLSKKRKKMLESILICSLFLDNKSDQSNASNMVRLLAKIYRPIAKARVKHMFFGFMIEKYIYNKSKKPFLK